MTTPYCNFNIYSYLCDSDDDYNSLPIITEQVSSNKYYKPYAKKKLKIILLIIKNMLKMIWRVR